VPDIEVLCQNVYEYEFKEQYDLIVIDPLFDDSNDNFIKLYEKLDKCVKDAASVFVFTDWQNSYRVQSVISRKTNWKQHNEIIWARTSPGKNGKRFKTGYEKILHYSPNPSKVIHNAQFRVMKGKDVLPYKNSQDEPMGWFFNEATGQREKWAEMNNCWVWHYTRPSWSSEELTDHGMQKQLMLADRLILSSTMENAKILDCFSGSGTFACSAKMLNRDYLGFEINPDYHKAILSRVDNIQDLKGYPAQCEFLQGELEFQ